jgi:gentisate 1,2-dioxygenase
MDRRSFFKVLVGGAALPIVAKLPIPAKRLVERAGAWASIRVESGSITAVTITEGGSRYFPGDYIVIPQWVRDTLAEKEPNPLPFSFQERPEIRA